MKRALKWSVRIVLIALIGIQFFPISQNQSEVLLESEFSNIYYVPKDIDQLLRTSCYDCHSNKTNYPWYTNVQPIAWILENHISEGKEVLNFSEFGLYSTRRKKNKLKSSVSQIENNKMPILSYTLIHRDARLSEKEKTRLIVWMDSLIELY